MGDRFDEARRELGADVVDTFLANFGMGPKYVPTQPVRRVCEFCGCGNAVVKERHPDTDINVMVIYCPDCGLEKEV